MRQRGEITANYLAHLRTQFSRGLPILFTGAGFSKDAVNKLGYRLPSSPELARRLWSIPFGGEEYDEDSQLQDVFDSALDRNKTETERVVRQLLTVEAEKCPDYYYNLFSMPWRKIYTLNIDDLIEKVLHRTEFQRSIRSISATTDHISDVSDNVLNVIHLNGRLEDLPDKVTFGRMQYATRPSHDPFYDHLRHDLSMKPVVFIGSRLEEGAMWQHFAMRGRSPTRDEKEFRPRSYLVVPELNASKRALLSRFNIVWLKMTGEEFLSKVLEPLEAARIAGNEYFAQQQKRAQESQFVMHRVADIPQGTSEPTEYLLGAEPNWVDVQHDRVAYRECYNEILAEISRIRGEGNGSEFLVVTGTAGTGKSSAMMTIAMQMEAEGVPSAWIDSTNRVTVRGIRDALSTDSSLKLLFIADADLYGTQLLHIVENALDVIKGLTIVCECRSTKLQRILNAFGNSRIRGTKYTIPHLVDNDIELILEILERENRLGVLRGMAPHERRRVLEQQAGRQMLVAMYKATHGEELKDKAIHELDELQGTQKFLYGLVCVAHAHRFMLSWDEIAIACGDDVNEWPRDLETLIRGRVILRGQQDVYKARHRQIAQFLYDSMSDQGTIHTIVAALIKIAATKSTPSMHHREKPKRMLVTFLNHNLIKRVIGPDKGRSIYNYFERLLDSDFHYWLHRGALELEVGSLNAAENFLHQASAIEPGDAYVQTELAYLELKKANAVPGALESAELVEAALEKLDLIGVGSRRHRAHAAHIAGTQGMEWVERSRMEGPEKRQFLEQLISRVEAAKPVDTNGVLPPLKRELKRKLLSMAVASRRTSVVSRK